jgi:hypothetical protein
MFSTESSDEQKISILNQLLLGVVGGDSHHIRQALRIELYQRIQHDEMFIEEMKGEASDEEGENYFKECELPLILGMINSDGSGKLIEYLTSAIFLDIWRPEEI